MDIQLALRKSFGNGIEQTQPVMGINFQDRIKIRSMIVGQDPILQSHDGDRGDQKGRFFLGQMIIKRKFPVNGLR